MRGTRSGAYDLVIADQTMPRMTGLQLAGKIACQSPAPPVVLYTGYADELHRQEIGAAGIKHLVRKPVEPLELRAVVARYVDPDSFKK